jgi:hypothetical protein
VAPDQASAGRLSWWLGSAAEWAVRRPLQRSVPSTGVGFLADQKARYNERFNGFTFYKFDGTQVTI